MSTNSIEYKDNGVFYNNRRLGDVQLGDNAFESSLSLGINDEGYNLANTDTNELKRWNGTGWQIILQGGSNSAESAYPVGSIYLSTSPADPSTALGFGTWQRVAEGRMLIGQSSADTDFDAGEKTGGSKTKNVSHAHATGSHTLTIDEMPSHNHNDGSFDRLLKVDGTVTIQSPDNSPSQPNLDQSAAIVSQGGNQPHNHGNTDPGGSSSQDVMNPYFVVYIWKRTA